MHILFALRTDYNNTYNSIVLMSKIYVAKMKTDLVVLLVIRVQIYLFHIETNDLYLVEK